MKEVFENLAEQAMVHVPGQTGLHTRAFSLEKFAELIVKESIAMCDELQAQYLTSRKSTMDFGEKQIYAEGEAACDIIKYKIKKQFGVE
jgi:hypothetical protein